MDNGTSNLPSGIEKLHVSRELVMAFKFVALIASSKGT